MPFVRLSDIASAAWILSDDEASSDATTAIGRHGLVVKRRAVSHELASACRAEALAMLDATLELPLHESELLLGEIRDPVRLEHTSLFM